MPLQLFIVAMLKKKQKNKRRPVPSPYWAARQVFEDALRLQHKGRSREAWKILKPLAEGEQPTVPLLELYIDTCDSLDDFSGMFFAAERLTRQRQEMLDFAALLKASFTLQLSAHLYHSLSTLQKHWPGQLSIPKEESLHEIGLEWMKEALPDMQKRFPELHTDDFMELMLLHEKSMQSLGSQRYKQAIEVMNKIIRHFPFFTPAYNNLALATVQGYGFDQAAEAINEALKHDPESLFALNLKVRQFEIQGEQENIEQTLESIREILRQKEHRSDHLSFGQLATTAEAFASQNKEQDVQWIYEKALEFKSSLHEEMSEEDRDNFGLIVHFSAVALAKQDKTDEAEKRWIEAKRYSKIDIIDNNLADLKKGPGMRNGPWFLEFRKMIPLFAFELLGEALERLREEDHDETIVVREISQKIKSRCPDFHRYLIKALWEGGPEAREFVRVFGLKYGHPELIAAMIAFCETSLGTDDYRTSLSHLLFQGGHLKSGPTKRWLKGKEQNLFFSNFRITAEPRPEKGLPRSAEKTFGKSFQLMGEKRFGDAIEILEKLLPSIPDFPTAHYNYAVCLLMLGEKSHYRKVIDEICRRFPDYSFGIGAKAGNLLGENKLDEAWKLIDRLMSMEEYHVSEFRMMMNLAIAYEIQMERPENAKMYHEMSREALEYNPLPPLKDYLTGKVTHQWE
ncbi:MAG: hypothetical protein FWC43_09625 [Planctomycetaceae bacterium]|nr:hypothetical protein [Planctomycetaceae bacterium]